jgi:opacity protein-like surface antigen
MLAAWAAQGVLAMATLLSSTIPAGAQTTRSGTHELHAYGGELFGDDLTNTRISGQTPALDDDLTYGVRYGYNITSAWGVELSLGQSASSVTGLPGADTDLDLTTFDVDAIWQFDTNARLVPYVLAGVGYARADLDKSIRGTANGRVVSIADDSGFTLNAGAGVKYFTTDRFVIRLEARYRYLDAVVD